jgi:2-polyprenyl-6-methoxyphenol hydroxylase-like FAD-dependent oxidoreductase
MFTDVLIVGAGPTGLMLANQLGRRGVRATIIDRHDGPARQSRAMAVHARTLEIYDKLGIADQAVAHGRIGLGANLWSRGRRRARIPFEEMGQGASPFPYVLMLGQDDNERIMGEHLRHWNIAVQWNTELVALEQAPAHVTATIKGPDGKSQTLVAGYVVGCDGARSAVRQMNGIAFPGEAYEHVFFVADTEATGSMVPDELNVYLWPGGFHLYFPMRGANHWRVIGILPTALRDRPDVSLDDLAPSLRDESGAGLAFTACHWFSTYRIHHRCTERFRDRRCFLAGDAAHVHSPMGGQGMNTGLQDAYNLAWKLALVIAGRAEASLLDSYQAERMPFAHQLLSSTDRAFQFVVSNTRLAGFLRTRIVPRVAALVMGRRTIRRRAFQLISQIGISYRDSPLSRTLDGVDAGAPRAGDRFPWLQLAFAPNAPREDVFKKLDDTCFNLIAIGQAAPSADAFGVDDLLRVHVVPENGGNASTLAAAKIAAPSYYLLRPDGHVGLAGSRLDVNEVRQWLVDCHLATNKY